MKTDEQEGAGADNPDETVSVDGSAQPPQPTTRDADGDEDRQGGKATKPNAAVAKTTKPEKTLATGETAMAIPQQGEIEAMVPMMVLGNGGGGKDVVKPLLGCGSFVRGRKRKKGDSIPFILPWRDYPMRLHGECP